MWQIFDNKPRFRYTKNLRYFPSKRPIYTINSLLFYWSNFYFYNPCNHCCSWMFLKWSYINRLRYVPFDVEWTQTRFSVHIQNKFNTLSELVFKYVFWLTYWKMGNRTYVIKRRLHTSSCSDEQNSGPNVHVHVIAGFTWQWSVPVFSPSIGIYIYHWWHLRTSELPSSEELKDEQKKDKI